MLSRGRTRKAPVRGVFALQTAASSDRGECCQTACKPGSVRMFPWWTAIPLRPTSRWACRDQPERRGGNALPRRPKARGSRSYSVLLPVGFTLPPLLPGARCAFAAPFRPCPREPNSCAGGLFSVALSLGSPPPAVSRHRIPVEPGLSSAPRGTAAVQPSGKRAAWTPSRDASSYSGQGIRSNGRHGHESHALSRDW